MINNSNLVPDYAIVVYTTLEKSNYIEKGTFLPIPDSDGKYRLSGLRPFVDDELTKLQSINSNLRGLYMDGSVPENLVYFNTDPSNSILVWYEKPQKRAVNFRDETLRKEYNLPATLFITVNEAVFVFLVKKSGLRSMGLDTPLYFSHYFNVWDSCELCRGNGYTKNSDKIGIRELMKKVSFDFFEGSYFTHPHRTDINLDALWEKGGSYPESKWKQAATVREIIKRYVKLK